MAAITHVDCFALESGDLLALQRSEQYFTSSQFFAHALRHVIARPQAKHSLDGNEALFPLKLTVKLGLDSRTLHPPLAQRRKHVGQRASGCDARNIAPNAANQLTTDP